MWWNFIAVSEIQTKPKKKNCQRKKNSRSLITRSKTLANGNQSPVFHSGTFQLLRLSNETHLPLCRFPGKLGLFQWCWKDSPKNWRSKADQNHQKSNKPFETSGTNILENIRWKDPVFRIFNRSFGCIFLNCYPLTLNHPRLHQIFKITENCYFPNYKKKSREETQKPTIGQIFWKHLQKAISFSDESSLHFFHWMLNKKVFPL